jgi:hypothetical protein
MLSDDIKVPRIYTPSHTHQTERERKHIHTAATPARPYPINPPSSPPRTRLGLNLHPPRDEPAILEALDHEQTPVLAVRIAHDIRVVVLVDHLCRRLAVLVHHSVHAVPDLAQVEPALVRLRAPCAFELRASVEQERELAGAPAVAFDLKI